MTHTYQITGMSCNGCRSKVEKALNEVVGISAIVTLDPPIAIITMEKQVGIEDLQHALDSAGKYKIEMDNQVHSSDKK